MSSSISRRSPTTRWARNSKASPKRSTKRPASRWRRWRSSAASARFVFASSCSIYGAAEGGPSARATRSIPSPPMHAPRSRWKTRCARAMPDEMTVTCLRFATACGMSDRLRLDLVLNDFVASALATGEITVLSDGTPWRPLIDVADMARAIEWAIGRDHRPRRTGSCGQCRQQRRKLSGPRSGRGRGR